MLNHIVLVGRIKELINKENKRDIILEVDRPFKENDVKIVDVFRCRAWGCIFNDILKLCSNGDVLAIKGRVVIEEGNYIVMSENISLLNKSKDNILKKANI